MPQISKFFRVALEGATTDGRSVSRQDIQDCADTFNRDSYGVRVNCEHFRGIMPEGPFGMLGDVVAVEAREDEVTIAGKTENRLGLYARIEPLDQLVELSAKKQKIYTSVEMAPNFGNSGKAGLIGLAVTDSPAMFGSEMLQFSAKNHIFSTRKASESNLIVEAEEVNLEFEDAPTGAADEVKGFFSALTDLLKGGGSPNSSSTQPPATSTPASPTPAADQAAAPAGGTDAFTAAITQLGSAMEQSLGAMAQRQDAADARFTKLEQRLASEPDPKSFRRRPSATGGEGKADIVY